MSQAEITDQTWHGLIKMAIKQQRRLGKFRSDRYDRSVVYSVRNIRELASMLVDAGIISAWPGGFRRLSSIEDGVVVGFRKIHKKCHNDP
jgi:hypothetical protein